MRRNGCYRKALAVKEQIQLQNSTYPICPRCSIMLEREWMKFCDNCGQKLDWKEYKECEYPTSLNYAGFLPVLQSLFRST